MLVFRSFAIGLSAAFLALLVMRPTVAVRVVEVPTFVTDVPPAQHVTVPVPTIVDAAPGITPAQLAMTIRLAPGEEIVSIDDIAVANDLGAGILLASRDLRARRYIDLGIEGPAGERRVLVLLH